MMCRAPEDKTVEKEVRARRPIPHDTPRKDHRGKGGLEALERSTDFFPGRTRGCHFLYSVRKSEDLRGFGHGKRSRTCHARSAPVYRGRFFGWPISSGEHGKNTGTIRRLPC